MHEDKDPVNQIASVSFVRRGRSRPTERKVAARVLYLTYDGLLEPLGQSQVLEYLKLLAREHQITVLSYEKTRDLADRERVHAMRRTTEDAGLRWVPLRYHKRPTAPATAFDLLAGLVVSSWLVARYRIQIVHARSYVPALLALRLKRLFGVRFIFDMRGFWADERVEGGLWRPASSLYRWAKRFEEQFLQGADVIVSLTHAGVEALRVLPAAPPPSTPVEVIPTCANLHRFRPCELDVTAPKGPFTLGYVGSVGTWYLFDEVLDAFRELRSGDPEARLTILNRGEHDYIHQRLAARGLDDRSTSVRAVNFTEIPAEMRRLDAGIFFIKPTFSKLASAPTKMAELLGCGVPCLANAGVGDVQRILEGERVGVVVPEFTPAAYRSALRRLLELKADPGTGSRCVEVAQRYFALERGVESYDRIYRSLAGKVS